MYLVAVLSEAALDMCFHPSCGNTAVYQDLVRAGRELGMHRGWQGVPGGITDVPYRLQNQLKTGQRLLHPQLCCRSLGLCFPLHRAWFLFAELASVYAR